jgi:DNA-binding response OmpR family regulator
MSNVLIVEDDLTIADLLQEALEADGYHVTGVARTTKEAVRSAEEHRPDVAVIDVRLVDGDLGTDVAAYLRATTTAGIMFSTGNSGSKDRMEECGDAVMTKPYLPSDVGQGLRIIAQLAESGQTTIKFRRNFRLLGSCRFGPFPTVVVSPAI